MIEFGFVQLTDTSEAGLVRTIAEPPASPEAEEELYRRLAPRVRLYGLRHLRDPHAAADLTQQVLLITLQSVRAGRVREPDKLASFVLGTCRMVVLDMRRGASRRERLLDQYARETTTLTPPALPHPDLDRLAACLMSLAERERSVVVMTFYHDRSSDEVADSLGLAPGNVRVIRHRALGRLRACLSGADR